MCQMVWEQGSVVIVNLTRLTEGGVAMCHRYWPEEGSDLYHIYEVSYTYNSAPQYVQMMHAHGVDMSWLL